MKNILMIGTVLAAGYAGIARLSAQERTAAQVQASTKTVEAALASIIKIVTGAPFSAVEEVTMTQTLADGNRIVRTNHRKVYRDSQGRERAEQEPTIAVLGEQVSVPTIAITDPITSVTYNLDPGKKTARKQTGVHFSLGLAGNMTGLAANLVRSASPIVPVKEQLAPDTIEGVHVQRTRTTTTIPAGQIGNDKDFSVVDEVWYSPELQLNVMTRHSDLRSGEAVYKLTNISRSEPDPALFQVPAGYTIMEQRPAVFPLPPVPPSK